ncbi:MAG: hypothetical protein JWM87_3136 [Candidatus Eremiobacteraeota bacterium]|nr:hypothetical protein [Candidatus Eremiobacteraeota bacterium]
MQHASAARLIPRAVAGLALVGSLGVASAVPSSAAPPIAVPPANAPTATQVIARFTERDARVESYSVPVHMDVRVHKLITFHIGLNGMQYFKRPDRLAMEMKSVPAQYRKLFAELGTPLTWPAMYDLRMVACDGDRGPYHLEGVPKRASDVARMLVDVDGDPNAPLHVAWTTKDGGTIDMRITEDAAGGYPLPKHADADMAFGGYKVHASIDYGPYTVNEAVADAVFASAGT